MIRNILFDWSGTLVDDLPAVWRATNLVFQRAGRAAIPLEAFRAEFCLPFDRFYERFTPGIPLSELEAWYHGHLPEFMDTIEVLPHAREFLRFCQTQGVRTALLSTIHRDHYAAQKERMGLEAYLDAAYVQVMDKRKKIREILQLQGWVPSETLFVGDMAHDVETARHGGVMSCAVLTGYNRLEQLRACAPDLIVEHLGELRALLEHNGMRLNQANGHVVPQALPYPVVTVGALIYEPSGQLLMLRTHKWSNLWGIPGGKVRFGETCEAALHREVQEETGLDIEEVEFVLAQDCIHSPEFYRDAHFVLLNYVARCPADPQVRLNREAEQFRWVGAGEVEHLALNGPTQVLWEHVRRQPRRWAF